ncbi:hypothetical protein Ana3638_10180 [Anaerocolumna sedimenticola]|uniref:Uncharacterized protein n=1 Tax=Anaerocolumna sedimenticola TaxID=2696063 RepID=A0A6P1TIR3_9FIRM|nr:hypothetical protein [Anaerocolumna sedimenticola]QHQ61090.1 hypothetical protein Ana3638_10180 [Anaerocolumna sedimenticola]
MDLKVLPMIARLLRVAVRIDDRWHSLCHLFFYPKDIISYQLAGREIRNNLRSFKSHT